MASMKADTPDEKAIEAQIDRVVAARAELEKANARFLLDIRMQLKPEQWKQLQALRMNRMQHERMGGAGRGEWGHDGQRPGMGGQGKFRGPGWTMWPGGQSAGRRAASHRPTRRMTATAASSGSGFGFGRRAVIATCAPRNGSGSAKLRGVGSNAGRR